MTPPTLAEAIERADEFSSGAAFAIMPVYVRKLADLAREISTPSAETVELVARALGLASFSGSRLDEPTRRVLVDDHWRSHIHQARAVLQALAEMGGE